MTTLIPDRGTKEFALYCAEIEWERAQGRAIETRWARHTNRNPTWGDMPSWLPLDWSDFDYRIAPTQHLLAERNAEVQAKWEGLEETGDPARRRSADGTLMMVEWKNNGGQWCSNDVYARSGSYVFTDKEEYRIVPAPEPPKPRCVPWHFESGPEHVKARRISDGLPGMLYLCTDGMRFETTTTSIRMAYSFHDVLMMFAQLDGAPCGTKEEAK